MAQLMPLPLTVSYFSKIQIGFTFLVPAYPGCPGKEAVKWLLLLLLDSIEQPVYIGYIKNPMTHCTQLPKQRKAVVTDGVSLSVSK